MTQSLLFVLIHLLGLAICLAIGPRSRPALCCALAFFIGLATVVAVALGLLIARVPYTPWTLAAALAVPLAVSVFAIARRGIDRRTIAVAAAWSLAFAAMCLPLTAVNLSIMTYDSHIFATLGKIIGDDRALAADVLARLHEWGVFQVLAQSLAVFVGEDLLYGLAPVFGLAFAPLFALSLAHAVEAQCGPIRHRIAWVGLVTAALFTIGMVAYHAFYLHTNMGSAIYLFGYVVFFWLAEVEREPKHMSIAMICLIALALQRTETPLVAMIFLALTVTQSSLPRRAIAGWLTIFVAVVGLWYEVLARHVSLDGAFLTPGRCRMVSGALVAFWLYWLASRAAIVRAINRFVPAAVAAACFIALAVAFAWQTRHVAGSARNWLHALRTLPYWAYTWYGIAGLLVLGCFLPRPSFHHAFVVGIPVFLGFVLLLAVEPHSYGSFVDDSANRMTIHIVPLLFFYLGLKVIASASGVDQHVSRSGTSPRDT